MSLANVTSINLIIKKKKHLLRNTPRAAARQAYILIVGRSQSTHMKIMSISES